MIQKLIEVLQQNGIFVNDDGSCDLEGLDSITYISLIIDVENAFGITIPEDYLSNPPQNLNDFIQIIKNADIK